MEAISIFAREGAGVRCAACDIELTERWMFLGGEYFCCRGCGGRGPCICTYEDREPSPAVRDPDFWRDLLRAYL